MLTPKANDAKAARWEDVTINSFLAGQKDILVSNDGAMAAGKTTKLEISFTKAYLDKKIIISGLDSKNNTVSEKAMTLRKMLAENGSITDSSCLSNSDNLLQSNGSSIPFDMDGCPRC